ncbi:esterase/lipase family protein [Streptomyces solicathayae]|uniref:Alpha/beta fold hydrolase n=1 Tax=Streptomyces solicathayae TaxID=3081768 RepID=A0ABZ0LMC7_9ACTN|nr:alpha/beta fold hydrolase [Streptomyces sp. HUAS YS2]WOX20604.1 alpha/beta fold hydrolase [Streptomyces sp. HUAS YS2]
MRSLRTRLTSALTGLAAAACLGLAGPAAPAHATTGADPVGPPQDDFMSAFGYSVLHPTAVPTGADDWNCRPGTAHPRPVVLVHGTFENRYANWAGLAPKLKRAGYCVFALDYGGATGPFVGTGDIAASARELAAFVDRVRAATGAAKVDLVGHSQGGMMPRHYIKFLGGSAAVDKLVAVAPTNHGTSLWGMGLLARAFPGGDELVGATCAACSQQITGSDFVQRLNAGSETHPDVTYTVITTWYDEVVTPYTSGYLSVAPNVTNQKVQDFCPLEFTEHLGISYNDVADRLVFNALDPAHAQRPSC